MHPSSRERLSTHHLGEFSEPSLLHAVARQVCHAGCLPRKELFESWAVARRILRRHRGGPVVDLAGGHGLVAWLLLLQDRSTPRAVVVDARIPPCVARLEASLRERWPEVTARLTWVQGDLDDAEITAEHRVLGIHACGGLTDRVLDRAMQARARVAVLPCCHSHAKLDHGDLTGWMDPALAIDATRAARLRGQGYAVHTTTIDPAITPMNRLLLGTPTDARSPGRSSAAGRP